MAVVRLTRSLPDEAAAMPLSISRPEILVDGSDGDFRRLIHRMDLSAEDANLWMGMLRKIKWKLLS